MKKNPQSGFGLVEILVAVAVISLTLFGLLVIASNFLVLSHETTNQIKASFLLEEGFEALRSIRDRSFSEEIAPLLIGVDYFLVFEEGEWRATTTVQILEGFTRFFQLGNVYRDTNDDIADLGTLDPLTKRVDLEVSWRGRKGTTSQRASVYLTDLFDN